MLKSLVRSTAFFVVVFAGAGCGDDYRPDHENGLGEEGEPCEADCVPGSWFDCTEYCHGSLVCVMNVCRTPGTVPEGELCRPWRDTDCSPGLVCVRSWSVPQIPTEPGFVPCRDRGSNIWCCQPPTPLPERDSAVAVDQFNTCTFEWQTAISPQSKTSTGVVATTDRGNGVKETTIDASAGGAGSQLQNPFVYVAFGSGTKVAIDDIAAKTDKTWDVAFRRSVMRVNGGDSGDGACEVAIVANTTLDKVTAVPAAGAFATDDFLDANCAILVNSAGYILTAFGGQTGAWYDFDTTNMKIVPKPDVYVVKTNSGSYVKVAIQDYYNANNEGGHFTIRWSVL